MQEQAPSPAWQHQSSRPPQGHPHPDRQRGADRPFWFFLAAVVTAIATIGAALIANWPLGGDKKTNGSTPAITESRAADPSPSGPTGQWRQVKVNSNISFNHWDFDFIVTREAGEDDFSYEQGHKLRKIGSAQLSAPAGNPSPEQCRTALADAPLSQVEAKADDYYCLVTDEERLFKLFIKERMDNGTAVMAVWVLDA